jgi:ABC-type transport system involved in multi-copper enzyme maturation permease subunit
MFVTLALTLVGGGMATAFTRVSQLWHTERTRQTLESWLLARLQPHPLVMTASLSGAAMALLLSLPGILLLAALAFPLAVRPTPLALTVASVVFSTLLASAVATCAFFAATLGAGRPAAAAAPGAAPPLLPFRYAAALGAVAVLVLGLWLRIEAVEHGWGRDWEQHPSRLLLAAGLLTPVPALLGFADRRWWVFRVAERVDFPIRPEAALLLLLILYAAATLVLQRWSERAYQGLLSDPEMGAGAVRSGAGDEEPIAAEAGGYWAGFANPVWTRELRTRLRGRETPQFIFFASVALAVGGFAPLVSAAGLLGDPLETARVARDVFFWLTMTLAALMILVAPGLTAEAVGAERTRGSLELLLTTPLRRSEILRGKLLGDLSVLGLLISPSLPLLGFCYLFHGASGPQVVGIFLALALTGLLCAGYGITASAIYPRSMAAKWQAYLLALGSCGIYGGPLWLIGALASPSPEAAFAASGLAYITPALMALYGFVLANLWSRACDQLEYAEL